jgi:secreted trypsin-like serine protease
MAQNPESAADPLREHMDLVARLADMVAGEDQQRFMLVFESLANQVDGFLARPGDEGLRRGRSLLLQPAGPRPAQARSAGVAPAGDSVLTDPVFLKNARTLIRSPDRIVGGIPSPDFPDCVAVGTASGWCCSGTLVAPNVVVTAAHCVAGGCSQRIFVGEDVAFPGDGQVIGVRDAVAHPGYRPPGGVNDLAVLILSEEAEVRPRGIADATALRAAATVRLAGYGNTDALSSGGYGRRRIVDVPIASTDPKYGADQQTEFVAGAPFLDRDSCNGDSGGPAYVQAGDDWYLAGATSRATASSRRPCGDGGIYTAVSAHLEWMRSVPGGRWDTAAG